MLMWEGRTRTFILPLTTFWVWFLFKNISNDLFHIFIEQEGITHHDDRVSPNLSHPVLSAINLFFGKSDAASGRVETLYNLEK